MQLIKALFMVKVAKKHLFRTFGSSELHFQVSSPALPAPGHRVSRVAERRQWTRFL